MATTHVDEDRLSPGQERLWFLQELDRDDPAYNMSFAQRLTGPLDPAALTAALDLVRERHEPLRTAFVQGPRRRVLPPGRGVIERLTAGSLDQGLALVAERANRPFDLAAGPPLRACLVRLAREDHLFCVVLHHMLGDAWSMALLGDELATAYNALTAGEPVRLAALPATYGDFVRAQRERAGGGPALEYWTAQLRGAPVLTLPGRATGRPGGPGAFHTVPVPVDLADRVRRLARTLRCTPFMVLMGAYQLLLARHAGQDEVCVGTPIAGRDQAEWEPLIGYFAGTLVLRGDLRGDPTAAEFLTRVRTTALAAYAHPDVPFEQLGAGPAGPFQTLFVLHGTVGGAAGYRDLTARPIDSGFSTVKFDLTCELFPEEGGYAAVFGYATGAFDRDTVTGLAARFPVLLERLTAHPDLALSRLDLTTEADRDRLAAYATGPDRSDVTPVLTAVRAQAGRRPDAPAVQDLSYGELWDRAEALAAELEAAGIGPGALVGLCLPRSPELVVALLGVLAAGAAYLPLDPDHPGRRRRLTDAARPHAIITADGLQVLRAETAANDRLGYLLYTSGSTGRPKGVLVTREAVDSRVAWMVREYGLGPGDRVLQFADLGFDTHVEEILPTLAAGATLVPLPDRGATLPDFLRTPEGRRLTVLDLPTPYWHELVDHLDPAAWPPGLRLVIIGGDRARPDAVAAWRATVGDRVRLVNTYGPTEATVIATAADLTGPDSVSIGRPLDRTTVRVLGADLEPVPPGAPGVLCLGGAGLARGYLGEPGQTAERFRPDPYGPPGARLYLTGDLARWRPGGLLEFLGRADRQVKIRGCRVEPAEVEAGLAEHPEVGQAVVVAAPDPAAGARLTAYVTPADLDPVALRGYLRARLPEYMVPAGIVALDRLPLTERGKIDQAALPVPAEPEPERSPSGPAEELIAEVWAEVLGPRRFGVTDDFFALGGHSLHLMRVAAALRDVVEVPLRTLFTERTLGGLAAAVETLLAQEIDQIPDDEVHRLLGEHVHER